jgi:ankyrin repeat protein
LQFTKRFSFVLVIIHLLLANDSYGREGKSFSYEGANPLIVAIDKGDLDAVTSLIKKGMSPDSRGDSPVPPLILAINSGFKEIAFF